MARQEQYYVKTPFIEKNFDENELTFSINHIRSRRPSVIYAALYFYGWQLDEDGVPSNEIGQVTTDRMVIGTIYSHEEVKIEVSDEIISDCAYYRLELVTMGIDSENPLYFTEVMLQEGDYSEYHSPSEVIEETKIGFINNWYVNMYKDDGDYLQVIRPSKSEFTNRTLQKCDLTILAPHFSDDAEFNDDIAVFMEAINQTDQTIDVLR